MDPTLMTEEERMKRRRELFAPPTMRSFYDPANVIDRTAEARTDMDRMRIQSGERTVEDRGRMFKEMEAGRSADRNRALDRATTLDVADRQFVQGPAGEATIKGRFDLFGEIARGNAATAQETIRQGADLLQSRLNPKPPPAPYTPVGSNALNTQTGQFVTPPAQPLSNALTPMVDSTTGQPIPGVYQNSQGQVIRMNQPAAGTDPLAAPPAAPTAQPAVVRRKTADGKIAIYDANTKQFLRYE